MIEAEGLENVERFEDVERLEEVQRLEDAEIVNIVDIVDSVQRVEHNGQGVGWWTGKVLLHMAYMIVLLVSVSLLSAFLFFFLLTMK